jgi:general secretion pathway protein A
VARSLLYLQVSDPQNLVHRRTRMRPSLSRPSKGTASESRIVPPGIEAYDPVFHFFGLRENPFHINPDPRFLAFTRQTQKAFEALTYGIQTNQGLMLLTGEVGTGKTVLINYLLNWLRQRQTPTSYIFNARLSAADLFDFALADFGISCESNQKTNKPVLLTKWLFARYGAGNTPILIVDEAQGLPLSVLEEIRLLLNLETPREKLLQILLVGQPELEEKFRRPEVRLLRQRVSVHCKIGPMNLPETRGYIQRRAHLAGTDGESVFLPEALDAVYAYSNGIPRVINVLCEHALINAYADRIRPVSPQIIQDVAREFQFDKNGPLDFRLNLNNTGSASATTTQSISAIMNTLPVEVPEPISAKQSNTPVRHVPVPVVDLNPATPAWQVMRQMAAKQYNSDERFTPRRQWKPNLPPSVRLWHQLRDKSIAMLSFPILRYTISPVIRWMREPVRPPQIFRRMGQGHHPSRPLIMITQVPKEIWKRIARLWHDTEASLEF